MLKGIGLTSIKQMNQDCKIYNFEELLSFDVEKYNFENKQKLKSQIEKLKKWLKIIAKMKIDPNLQIT